MRKLIVSIFISACSLTSLGQQPKQVQLVSSQLLKGLQQKGLVRIIKPVFSHEGSTLAADSANFNQDKNIFDAFGSVVITQSNGTAVYSELLNYNGNTKLAILTRNVRLVDGDATLTTDLLTYNMATKIGTYTGGGKIVNGQNVLTSKRGYYFANSRDAYFRNNVVVTSPDALIKSDTLRYNTTSKIAYFYGPTNIYGKDDTLYTENGQYNTSNDQARFGKNNLYVQGNKSLKGDSLFYDRRAGYGRAINNITFVDKSQKITFRGDMGLYRKADESILATKNAYVIITTESDSAKVDSIYMTADTLYSKVVLNRLIKPYKRDVFKKDNELQEEPVAKKPVMASAASAPKAVIDKGTSKKPDKKRKSSKEQNPPDSVPVLKADTLLNKAVDTVKVLKPDSIPPKKANAPVVKAAESTVKPTVPKSGAEKRAARKAAALPQPVKAVPKVQDTVSKDTAHTRIVMAYHRSKIFKSDLQARSDSMFFSYGDSTVRCYRNPMIWTQGSQLSGDTVYLQMKNKKLDNMLLQHNGFIVNTEANDSTHFNQVKGKVITGYFKDGRLNRMYVDGNAESIYYVKEDTSYSGMNRMISSRIKVLFEKSKLKDIISIRKPEGNYYPIEKIPEDSKILKGFVWKPKDRPKSKEEIIPSLRKKVSAKPAAQKTPVKAPVKKIVPVKTPVSQKKD